GAGDLDIVEFWLTDSTGTRKSNFKSDEAIYVHVKIRNIGAGPVNAGADTSIWKKGNLGVGVSSDIPMYFNNHPSWAAGQERTFVSRAGGVTGNSSCIESAPGSYVAKALTNWDNTI